MLDCYGCALLKASPFPGIQKSNNITLIYRIVTHEPFIHLYQLDHLRWFILGLDSGKILKTK